MQKDAAQTYLKDQKTIKGNQNNPIMLNSKDSSGLVKNSVHTESKKSIIKKDYEYELEFDEVYENE